MDKQIQQNVVPDYKTIYIDILNIKFPDKAESCLPLLQKETLSATDILKLNRRIFGIPDEETDKANQQHRSYTQSDILQILDYQKKFRLNNSRLANHFKLSRNTVTKWRKMFLV